MASFVIWGFLGFLVLQVASQSSLPPALLSATPLGFTNGYVQGSGVVNAGSMQNFIDFSFSNGVLSFGDQIGFYVWDSTSPTASTSHLNEYDCGGVAAKLKSPLLSISPSFLFNQTAHVNLTLSSSLGASRTPFFGGLAAGRYKLCYCKKPPVSSRNPDGECRSSDYKFPAGSFFFYDVPEVRQKRAVNSAKAGNRFLFQIKKLDSGGSNDKQRIVIPDLQNKFQTDYHQTRGCGESLPWFSSGVEPNWSNGLSNTQTTQLTPLKLVRSFHSYDEVAFHVPVVQTPTPTSSANTKAGFYSVCLCDIANIGSGGTPTNCADASTCTTSACTGRYIAPVEIATLFVHDLGFLLMGHKVFSVNSLPVSTSLSFTYAEPAAVFNLASKFWFVRSSLPCGNGVHSVNPDMTPVYSWPGKAAVSVDFSQATNSTLMDPFRMCLQLPSSTLSIDNVVVVVSDFEVHYDNMADMISDNNQVGLRPFLSNLVTGGQYQKNVNAAAKNPGLWFSENFVTMQLRWNNSVAKFQEIYAVKSPYPCSVWTPLDQFRSPSYVIAHASNKIANITLDLGKTLFNSTVVNVAAATDTGLLAPANTANSFKSNSSLYSEYSLCVTCSGCATFGFDTGVRFNVLAALHVYQDVGFEKPYRFATSGQQIIIASNVVPSTNSLLFLSTDQLWFSDGMYPCFDWNTVGYNTNSTGPVYGNQTTYASITSAAQRESLLNAFSYIFDFSSISNPDGRVFKLCVKRNGFAQIFDFPGCAVSIIPVTRSPTVANNYATTTSTVTYSASPVVAKNQQLTLKAVVRDSSFNQISWHFTGVVQKADKLSVSSFHGDPSQTSIQCSPTTYSYMTFPAFSGNSATASSPAQSAQINGLMPGMYSLCYCNTLVDKVSKTCRTARDFSQFAGFVYFNGVYNNVVTSVAFTVNIASNFQMKLSQATQYDRIYITPSTGVCGVDYSLDSTLPSKPMHDFRVTKAPTATTKAPVAPTKGPTKAPTTSNPTTVFPTTSPTTRSPTTAPTTRAPTTAGRRRLLSKSPVTKAPTRAPSTKTPSTRAPTKAPITRVPSLSPTTRFPTKVPIANPTKNPSGVVFTKSPTTNPDGTLPYVTQKLATNHIFSTAGQFKICYCWHDRFRGSFDKPASQAKVTITVKFPTVNNGDAAATPFELYDNYNHSSSNCGSSVYKWQKAFGVHVANLVVHDLYLVSFLVSSQATKTTRLAVRSSNAETIRFTASQSSFGSSNTAWFQSYKTECSSSGITGVSTRFITNFGASGVSNIVGIFDFSGMSRACTNRRANNFDTVEEQFFYRLCVSRSLVLWDFKNVMVTVTDISVLSNYRNPIVPANNKVTIKFNEACGFLWAERNWKTPSQIIFVSADVECASESTAATNVKTISVTYTMYEGSLIKYFLDDSDYPSVIEFAATPKYRTAFRMCLIPQATTPAALYIDYPTVAIFPVSEYVQLSSRHNSYDTTACVAGYLGCKCDSKQKCLPNNYMRALDQPLGVTTVVCNTPQNLCVAPTRLLWGPVLVYSTKPTCPPSVPCANFGPGSGSQSRLFLKYTTTAATAALTSADAIKFVPRDSECSATSGVTSYINNFNSESIILVNTQQLGGGSRYHRMCVKTTTGLLLDYFNTGFTLSTNPKTDSPSQKTFKPTTYRNKGNSLTYSPTMSLPEFHHRSSLSDSLLFNPSMPQHLNALYIVQPSGSQNVLYTQWTNFTWGQVLKLDTLRVYRDTPIISDRSVTSVPANKICSADWFSKTRLLRNNDLVMEVKINKANIDQTTIGAVPTVEFPPLAKGYYTACFCRATPSKRCQMSAAGMIYSSASQMVSVTGVGTINKSFRITPALDYEVNAALFDKSKLQFITANHFCLSTANDPKANACGSCVLQGLHNQNSADQEFKIELTSDSFPLLITNKKDHGTTATNRVYNLCFKDPMLMQFEAKKLNATYMQSKRPDINATNWLNGWAYGLIGTVYLSDLNFQWEQNGGFSLSRSSYSVPMGGTSMVKISYASNTQVIAFNDNFWFTDSNHPCSVQGSIVGASTQSLKVPATTRVFFLYFSGVVTGRFYRLCVQPTGGSVRDFGIDFGAWVTDIAPSTTNFKFFNSFHLSLSSALSLMAGDEFFLLHVGKLLCSEYETLLAGWVSPNVGVFNNSIYHNMGKMPQITLDSTASHNINIPLGFAGYRLCVKRTVPSSQEVSFLDYAGQIFTPQGSMYIVDTVVSHKTKSTVKILSGLTRSGVYLPASYTIQVADVVWFNRADTNCARSVWSSGTNSEQSVWSGGSSHKYGSNRVTIAAANFPDNVNYAKLEIDFSNTDATTTPFRLCVERLSWKKGADNLDISQTIVQSYPDVLLTVSNSIVSTTPFPTSFDQFRNQQTKKSSTNPVSPLIVRTVYTDARQNTFKWGFEGGFVDPKVDKIAIVTYTPTAQFCDGSSTFSSPVFLIPAASSSSADTNEMITASPASTAPFGTLAVGKYYICFCQASSSVTGDCSNELGWRQTIGFLYSFAVTPMDVPVSTLSSSRTSFTLWFNQKVQVGMKIMAIDSTDNNSCGNVAASTALNVALEQAQVTAEIEATNYVLTTGLTVTALYTNANQGIYQLCLCPSTCAVPNTYGGHVGTLIVHDIKLNQQNVVTVSKHNLNMTNITVTWTKLFTAGEDQVWFARDSCGLGNHTPNSNISETSNMPVSGGYISVNYTNIPASMATMKMCVKQNSTVYQFSSVGFIVTDVVISDVSPERKSNSPVGISYQTGLERLTSAPANRVVYFRDISRSCESACIDGQTICEVVSNQFTTKALELPISYSQNNVKQNFDFSQSTPLSAFRLCVLLDKTQGHPRSFIDLNDIRVYPAPSDTTFFVTNGAALHLDNYKIFLTVPSIGAPRNNDFLYFRHSSMPCLKLKYPASGQQPPQIADLNTSNVFKFLTTSVPMQVNLSQINKTKVPLRLCVLTSQTTLDYNTKKLFMTSVTLSTKVCRPTGQACKVDISVTDPEGFFTSPTGFGNTVSLWFQRETNLQKHCLAQVPSTSGADFSQGVFFSTSGSHQIPFSSTTSSLQHPLKLCVKNGQLSVVADFPTVYLYVLDVSLTPVTTGSNKFFTQYLTPRKNTPVRISAALSSVPVGSHTWFQQSSESCSKPTKANSNQTSINTTSAVLAGTDILYDFSLVQPPPNQMLAFRLCYDTNGLITDANNVEVKVLQYSVDPLFFTQTAGQAERIKINPGSDVEISQYVFCREDVPCPTLNVLVGLTSSNVNCSQRAFVNPAGVNIEFWNVESRGKLMRLCGIRNNLPSPSNIVDLSPVGVYLGSLSLDSYVMDWTSLNNGVQVTWDGVLAPPVGSNTTVGSKVWFQTRPTVCSNISQLNSAISSNAVDVKQGSFPGNYQFSTIKSSVLKLCADVSGEIKDFTGIEVYLINITVGATSVRPASGQNFTVTYNSVPDFSNVSLSMSSDVTCKSGTGATATPFVSSVSGSVHSFDFSQGKPSLQKWILCLRASTTSGEVIYPMGFASVYLVDVGDLGKVYVSSTDNQRLQLSSSVSLLTNDTVWFSSHGCQSNTSRSTSVVFTGSADYSFDFSAVTPSLDNVAQMCVSRNPVFGYSSSFVQVVPQYSFGGPFLDGQRTFDLSGLSAFLGTSQVAFVSNTSTCSGATFVDVATTTFNFATKGSYNLCVKQQSGKVHSLSSLSVSIQTCQDICPSSRSTGVCTPTGTCQTCKERFTGDRCQSCVAGYTGANCDVCDNVNNFHCNNQTAGASCGVGSSCIACTCNGHYDKMATDRCPQNKCVCDLGYTGGACQDCLTGYYRVVLNTTSTFECRNCADKCFSRASSCTASQCQCIGNYDAASNCEFCQVGYQVNVTSGVCVKTSAPTRLPTVVPSVAPSVVPSVAPTVAGSQCQPLNDKKDTCGSWAKEGYCTNEKYLEYMNQECAKTCCLDLITTAPTASPTIYKEVCNNTADSNELCSGWAQSGYCTDGSFINYMKDNCPNICCRTKNANAKLGACDSLKYDSNIACSKWTSYCDTETYAVFMASSCAQTCCRKSICSSQYTDNEAVCGNWASKGYCSSYKAYMDKNCGESCCLARSFNTAREETDNRCGSFSKQGYCGSYKQYMSYHCSKTCILQKECSAKKDIPDDANPGRTCVSQKQFCVEPQYQAYMKTYCPRTCCDEGYKL